MNTLDFLLGIKKSGINIQLVNDNLKLNAPEGKLTPGLLKELKERKTEIIGLLKKGQKREQYSGIQPVEKREYYDVSFAQRRLWILSQFETDSSALNMPLAVEIYNNFNPGIFQQSLQALVDRHESLRTVFITVSGEPKQKILEDVPAHLDYIDLRPLDESAKEAKVNEIYISGIRFTFDLEHGPLFLFKLVQMEDNKYLLIFNTHHIVNDGWSQGIIINEVMTLYNDILENKAHSLQPLKLQYKDYATWNTGLITRDKSRQAENFWMEKFSDKPNGIPLPTDHPRGSVQTFEGGRITLLIGKENISKLLQLAREEEATLFISLMTLITIFLHKYTGVNDIIIGSPIAGRRHKDLHPIVGFFVNTLVYRNNVNPGENFLDLLKQVKTETIDCYENQDYPFDLLVEKLDLARNLSRTPLFNVLLTYNNAETEDSSLTIEGVQAKKHTPGESAHVSIFDLIFIIDDLNGSVQLRLTYSSRLFEKDTILRMGDNFMSLVEKILENPGTPIAELDYIHREEYEKLLYHFNATEEPFPVATIHELFEEQVEKSPDDVALVYGGDQISYRELNQRANRLADKLKAYGIKPHSIVGQVVEPSIDMIAGILGILKAGAAYLPIDPQYPRKRITDLLLDNQCSVVLVNHTTRSKLDFVSLYNIQEVNALPVQTPPRPQNTKLDDLPHPNRTLVNYNAYHQQIGIAMAKHTASIQTTRGCPYNCAYCHKIFSKNLVARSAENIFDEIKQLYEGGCKRVVIIDDIFNLDIKNSSRLLEMIIKYLPGLQLFFPNGLRGDILTEPFIDLMVEAGTVNIDIALESASPRIQKLMRKHLNLEKFKHNVGYIVEKYPQLIIEMELMTGFPTETEKEAEMILDFISQFKWLHFPNLNILKIFPNTDMFRLAIDHGVPLSAIEESTAFAYHELPSTLPYSTGFARKLQTRFLEEYMLSKERLLHVLPYQAKLLTEDELIQKYDSYFPTKIESFSDILSMAGIAPEELPGTGFYDGDKMAVPDFQDKMREFFPSPPVAERSMKILLLDLTLLFSDESGDSLYTMVEEPLGLMYLLSFIDDKFKARVSGKIAKSRIDFDSFDELKALIDNVNPHLIGIRTLTFYKEFFHHTVSAIRHWGVDVPIVAGGPYASSDYKQILQDYKVDLAAIGEGEFTLAELIEKMLENNYKLPPEDVLAKIPGIAFIKEKDKHVLKSRRNVVFLEDDNPGSHTGAIENPGNNAKPEDLLYLISTSGSTGKPKSVMLEHRNMCNLIQHQFSKTNIPFKKVLQFASPGFDVCAQEIFSTLLSGGELYLVDRELKEDLFKLLDFIRENEIATLFLPPAVLKLIFSESSYTGRFPDCVKHIIAAGEQLVVPENMQNYLKENNVYLHNHYGPSETHVVTTFTVTPGNDPMELPPIGKPISNTRIYILDEMKQPAPIGVVGELYIAGKNVGRGYFNREELTGEKFVRDPFVQGERMYRTGDLARWLADGNIQFLGRADNQVKIRGFRIEPGEIETQLTKIASVKDAAVLDRRKANNETYLCAYIVSDREIDFSDARMKLDKVLPNYMIPDFFIQVEELPLTPHGKIDRKLLPDPTTNSSDTYISPRNNKEEKLAAIWSDVLGLDKNAISIDSNFFELGGHSLKATTMIARVHKELNVELPLSEIFKEPRIMGLARYIDSLQEDRFVEILPAEKKDYYPLSPPQKRLFIFQQMNVESTVYNLSGMVPLQGEPDIGKLEETFNKLIRRHESLRTSFHRIGRELMQRVHRDVELKIEYFNDGEGVWGTGPVTFSITADAVSMRNKFIRPFDLSQVPLLRVGLMKTGESQYVLLYDMHHNISDGVSLTILVRDFMALYQGETLDELPFQYKDYAEFMNSRQAKEKRKKQEAYWLEKFSGVIPVLHLPYDYPRPEQTSFEGKTIEFDITKEDTDGLNMLALSMDATMYMILLAIYTIMLSKLSMQEDIVVGSPIAGRQHDDLSQLIGMFVNTLPMRNRPTPDTTFTDFAVKVKENALAAFRNQDYYLEDLVSKLAVERDVGRNPLFDVMFVFQNMIEKTGTSTSPALDRKEDFKKTSKTDLFFITEEKTDGLFITAEYSAKLFKEETVRRFSTYFKDIVRMVLENPDIKLKEINLSYDIVESKANLPETAFAF